ncbi:P-loop containing nucleoside triphosphatehydrolases superfamily protein [Striga asiatica]|uniref:P-loop containing nucleoside triphosphatehydrolases superfamily protein n=1 Tax=Striga asiatica TaxID=4170 RepID=A0A5A7R3S2_STRAF|nr:P-loop containing nucleoside triphosphatehydrolases superfamily protein [Striga asiatica]
MAGFGRNRTKKMRWQGGSPSPIQSKRPSPSPAMMLICRRVMEVARLMMKNENGSSKDFVHKPLVGWRCYDIVTVLGYLPKAGDGSHRDCDTPDKPNVYYANDPGKLYIRPSKLSCFQMSGRAERVMVFGRGPAAWLKFSCHDGSLQAGEGSFSGSQKSLDDHGFIVGAECWLRNQRRKLEIR